MNKTRSKLIVYLLTGAIILTFSPQLCLAMLTAPLTGEITADGGGITATDGWDVSSTKFTWDVIDKTSYYEYNYTFTVPEKGISHFIIEVSPDFELTWPDYSLLNHNGPVETEVSAQEFLEAQGNPEIPGGGFWGIKYDRLSDFDLDNDDVKDDLLTFTVSFNSMRVPEDGHFYAKDGTDSGEWVYAFNDAEHPIAVPDTTYIPVPASVIIGLLGMGVAGIKLRKFA